MSRARNRRVGAASADQVLGKRLYSTIDFVPTSGTAEEQLLSYTVGAGALAQNYQGLIIHAAYVTDATANVKTGRLKVGTTTLVAPTGAHNDLKVVISARLWRFTATTFQGYAIAFVDGQPPLVATPFGSVTWANPALVELTGETPTIAGDMTGVQLNVDFIF